MTEKVSEALGEQEIEQIVQPGAERRASQRFPYRVTQRFAPVRRGIQGRFREMVCSDISRGGISFFLDSPPDFDEVAIELKTGNQKIVVLARIVGHDPIKGLPAVLVRCQFTSKKDD
jgi:hypothetical protein